MLGLFEESVFQVGTVRLEPGDLLVAFTDGVSESWSDDEVEFGEERVIDVIRRNAALPSGELVENILGEVDEYIVELTPLTTGR